DAIEDEAAFVVAALDDVALDADDALDEVLPGVGRDEPDEDAHVVHDLAEAVGGLLGLGGEPAAGVLEDHDVAAVHVERSRRELRDEHAVAYEERVAHRDARDEERLDEEGLDEE